MSFILANSPLKGVLLWASFYQQGNWDLLTCPRLSFKLWQEVRSVHQSGGGAPGLGAIRAQGDHLSSHSCLSIFQPWTATFLPSLPPCPTSTTWTKFMGSPEWHLKDQNEYYVEPAATWLGPSIFPSQAWELETSLFSSGKWERKFQKWFHLSSRDRKQIKWEMGRSEENHILSCKFKHELNLQEGFYLLKRWL